jgi:hypothetical protein
MRTELPVIRRDDVTKEFLTQYYPYTGVRLAVGLPIVGYTERTGSSGVELAEDFERSYQRPDEAGDIAGGSFADANDVGRLKVAGSSVSDELTNDDSDYFAVTLDEFGAIAVEASAGRPLKVLVIDEGDKLYASETVGSQRTSIKTDNLLPGRYYLKVEEVGTGVDANKYTLQAAKVPASDSGVPRLDAAALADAAPITSTLAQEYEGFVGVGDKTDNFPIAVRSDLGGLVVTLSELTAPVRVTFVDQRLEPITEALSPAGEASFQMPVPASSGDRGFIQVESEAGSTVYKLEITAKRLYEANFRTKISQSSPFAVANKTYDGFLSAKTPRLLLPVRLSAPAKLRAELTGLAADIDLDILDEGGTRLQSNHQRDGAQPEFFEQNLQAGAYFLQITLQKGANTTPFKLFYALSDYTGGTAAVDPQVGRAQAESLGYLTASGADRQPTIKAGRAYYSFQTSPGDSFVNIDLYGFSADADLDLFLEDASGRVLAKSTNVGDQIETITYTLGGGRYYIRIEQSGTSATAYPTLSVTAQTEMTEPPLESWWGPLVEENGDWKVYRSGDECTMVTLAQSVTPRLGWRRELPWFYISVERGADAVRISMDYTEQAYGAEIYEPGSVRAYVDGRGSIPAQFEENWLKPLVSCDQGLCVDDTAIRGFRYGHALTITGTHARDGSATEIVYSLQGYTKSAQAINSICGGNANWIWNK